MLSVAPVAVDPTLEGVSAIIFSTQPWTAWLLVIAGIFFGACFNSFWSFLSYLIGLSGLKPKLAKILLAISALGMLLSGAVIITVQSQRVGKLVTPRDPPPSQTDAPEKEQAHSPRFIAVSPRGPAPTRVTAALNPSLPQSVPGAAPPRLSLDPGMPDVVPMHYIIRRDLARYPGGFHAASDASAGLSRGMRVTLSDFAAKATNGSDITISGTFVVETVQSEPGPLETHETATLRKITP